MYSDDDPTLGPRPVKERPREGKRTRCESEDEDEPDPWNAICIVGFRVYSQDEEVEVVILDSEEDRQPESTEPLKVDEGTEADVEDGGQAVKREETMESDKMDELLDGEEAKDNNGPPKVEEAAESEAKEQHMEIISGEVEGQNEPPKLDEAEMPIGSKADKTAKSITADEEKLLPGAKEAPAPMTIIEISEKKADGGV